MEQVKALKEENALLKKFLSSPNELQLQAQKQQQKNDTTNPSYAGVADAIKPMNKIMRFYTKASTTPPNPLEVISAPAPTQKPQNTRSSAEFSQYKVLIFKGCHKKTIGEYKRMLPQLGFPSHLARHLIFLTEDILQVVTFDSKSNELITVLESISNEVRYLPDFDPLKGSSYEDYGDFTDESASKSYLALMKQAADKLANEISRVPSLKRTYYFLKKLIESKCIHFAPTPRPTKIFCLGDYLVKKENNNMVIEQTATVTLTESSSAPAEPKESPTEMQVDEEVKKESPITNDQ